MKRWSAVWALKINSVSQASVIQVGDNELIKPVSRVLAVQREVPEFYENEGNFKQFDIYSRVIPLPPVHNENFAMTVDNTCSRIQVGGVKINAVSAASVLQIGSNSKLEAEARIKHIRQFITAPAEHGPSAGNGKSKPSIATDG